MSVKDVAFSGSREQIIAVEAFLPVVEEAAAGLLALRDLVCDSNGRKWRRRFVSRVLKEIHTLRTVLNDYQAHENGEYCYFTELVAGIRGFSTVIYTLNHLRERLHRSPLSEMKPQADEFLEETTITVRSTSETLRRLFRALLEECERLGIEVPPAESSDSDQMQAETTVRRTLPHNLDEEEMRGEAETVAQVAASFLRVAEEHDAIVPGVLAGYPDLRRFARTKLDEEAARSFESRMHTIQSKYDTYIQHTSSEARDPDLKRLRSVVSITLHLFETATLLVHFYERHENDIRSERAKERIAGIVDKAEVLDRAVNYAFLGASWLLAEGSDIASRLIPAYTSIETISYPIAEDVRLHLRPAALIATIVNHHGTPVTMSMGSGTCDASSVTEVIFLAGSNLEAREVTFRGDRHPLVDLGTLFEIGLRNEGHEEIRQRLDYLAR